MRRKLRIISLLSILTTLSVAGLYSLSDRAIHKPGSFVRLFPPHAVDMDRWIDVKYNGYYIAGGTKQTIYLGNSIIPFHLVKLNRSLTDTTFIKISMKDAGIQRLKSVLVKVDSPHFYMSDGIAPALFAGSTFDWTAHRYMYDSIYFIESIPIGKRSHILRSVSHNNEYVLGKETCSYPYFKQADGLLEKQLDGLFCTDGILNYSKELSRLVYVYHYRNQYIQMDTNLNLVSKGNTIDTTTRANIKPAKIDSENAFTLASPANTVNKNSCVFRNWLFVHSNLRAKNEEATAFESASVIDVYDLNNDRYKFSFYLFDHNKVRMTTFRVFENYLVAMYGDNKLVTYKLSPYYFRD